MNNHRSRLDRLAARFPAPPPRAPGSPTAAELAATPTETLLRRLKARLDGPENRARRAELAGLSDEALLARWARRPC